MRVNLKRPLQWVQWASYGLVLFTVHVCVVLPLATLLFHDFYKRLIPNDSMLHIPLSKLYKTNHGSLCLEIDRMGEGDLPVVANDGLTNQRTFLHGGTTYNLDFKIKFYCLTTKEQVLHTVFVELESNHVKMFMREIPVVCARGDAFVETLLSSSRDTALRDKYATQWVNELDVEDAVVIPPQTHNFFLSLKSSSELIFDPDSRIQLRATFKQGLRNFMLKRWIITYLVGITLFQLGILLVFTVVSVATFIAVLKNTNHRSPKRA
ncbi:seipin KNAG_0B06210 [Huiozyma naganishii CBS 8797]|uniref:Seipin n=1 Tax=Huiozyma naganishii (strain ATCC MYA-139 / BCRC 22969 / CBS 8797 / KCTC 17520 / NBRC 10181 / NCYC 3082 / Yp74L-3) TaxID=1071383 RepID=J7S5B9_HUIN7|nr:hypothetical protein KNAG_0B06210 [Kazachstania naganishii CBS 8797]CCK69051.1 hypothetical protein KNAG_0B06210 [Kazachstania naganishii CBS 8797]